MTFEELGDSDVRIRFESGRTLRLVGTAHVSAESVEHVERAIREERPDVVSVELDEARLAVFDRPDDFEKLDMIQVLRGGKTWFLIANLLLSSWQKKIAQETGSAPGAELKKAVDLARETGARLSLADRSVQVTLRRAWNGAGFLGQLKMLSSFLVGGEDPAKKKAIGEAELAEMRKRDALEGMMAEMAQGLPSVHRAILSERDEYLASRIHAAGGDRALAVVGAAHVAGIRTHLAAPADDARISALETVPPGPAIWKWLPWIFLAIPAGVIVWGFLNGKAYESLQAIGWYLAGKSVGAGLGALVALAHPVAILAALLLAPFTGWSPVVSIGVITAVIQVFMSRPRVADFRTAGDDSGHWRGWYRNRLVHVLFVFVAVNLGSMLGKFAIVPALVKIFR